MAGIAPHGDPAVYCGIVEHSPYRIDRYEETRGLGASWYYSRKEIEENSPSRRDGIDLKKETYLRKSYCTFLQDLGMRLKVPQVTIATAIVFCHRFFLRQSHVKNDRRTIATVCMFLAGKVEETPRPLKDVILVSYEIIHKKDPDAVQRIKQREVYEQQKELILIGERVVLATLGFDLNVHHPYKPLVEAIKKFKVAQNALAQVAWNFVNDGLRTSLCLQFKAHHIAAGAIFLAAKFLKVKLPSDGDKVWWQEFDVTPRQLEEVSNQMLELYEQNKAQAPSSHGNETEGSSASGAHQASRTPVKPSDDRQTGPHHAPLPEPPAAETTSCMERDEPKPSSTLTTKERAEAGGPAAKPPLSSSSNSSPMVDAIKKIDRDKVKAALEKRRKSKLEAKKVDVLDEDDLIERELEHGVELAAEENERIKQERRHQNWSNNVNINNNKVVENGGYYGGSENNNKGVAAEEEGELSVDDGTDFDVMESGNRKRKPATDGYGDARLGGRFERAEREHKRFRHENQV